LLVSKGAVAKREQEVGSTSACRSWGIVSDSSPKDGCCLKHLLFCFQVCVASSEARLRWLIFLHIAVEGINNNILKAWCSSFLLMRCHRSWRCHFRAVVLF